MDNAKKLEQLIDHQIELIEEEENDDERKEKIKLLLDMIGKSNDYLKIDAMLCETEAKYETELRTQTAKSDNEHEWHTKQVKNDRVRAILDFGKNLVCVAAFVTFEILAHKRDIADVIDRDQMHVRKNPFKLKF